VDGKRLSCCSCKPPEINGTLQAFHSDRFLMPMEQSFRAFGGCQFGEYQHLRNPPAGGRKVDEVNAHSDDARFS